MNLKEILDYRQTCLICQSNLTLKSYETVSVPDPFIDDEGIHFYQSNDDFYSIFRFDGTYKKMKYYNSMYTNPITFTKTCLHCDNISIFGSTTIKHIGHYSYNFQIYGDSSGNYVYYLNREQLFFNSGNIFVTVFSDKISYIKMAQKEIKFPMVKTSFFNNIEELNDKINTYILLS